MGYGRSAELSHDSVHAYISFISVAQSGIVTMIMF